MIRHGLGFARPDTATCVLCPEGYCGSPERPGSLADAQDLCDVTCSCGAAYPTMELMRLCLAFHSMAPMRPGKL